MGLMLDPLSIFKVYSLVIIEVNQSRNQPPNMNMWAVSCQILDLTLIIGKPKIGHPGH